MSQRYLDPMLNALMDSHQVLVRADLYVWDPTPAVLAYTNRGALNIVAGSVDADRSGSVRRTATLTIDPNILTNPTLGPLLSPFGPRVRIYRGVRYPGGYVDEEQVFYGRIDSIDVSYQGLALRCADLAADVVDARFVDTAAPDRLPGAPTTVLACIKALITEVHPGIGFDTTGVTDVVGFVDPAVRLPTAWADERSDALDSLATQLSGGCEWFIDMKGIANIHPLPAVIAPDAKVAWVIDSGDEGVLVDRTVTQDRSGVYNGVHVSCEAVNGTQTAEGYWYNTTAYGARADDPMYWGGPYGKVSHHYTGQQLNPPSTAGANALAKTLGLNSLAGSRSLAVTCIPNPRLQLGSIVRVFSKTADLDGMYFVQSFSLPLDPETAMTMTLYSAYQTAGDRYRLADLRIPEGSTWRPDR